MYSDQSSGSVIRALVDEEKYSLISKRGYRSASPYSWVKNPVVHLRVERIMISNDAYIPAVLVKNKLHENHGSSQVCNTVLFWQCSRSQWQSMREAGSRDTIREMSSNRDMLLLPGASLVSVTRQVLVYIAPRLAVGRSEVTSPFIQATSPLHSGKKLAGASLSQSMNFSSASTSSPSRSMQMSKKLGIVGCATSEWIYSCLNTSVSHSSEMYIFSL